MILGTFWDEKVNRRAYTRRMGPWGLRWVRFLHYSFGGGVFIPWQKAVEIHTPRNSCLPVMLVLNEAIVSMLMSDCISVYG